MWQCEKCGREFKAANQSHYCGEISSIDAYIADQEESIRPVLERVRKVIRESAPEAVEKISWRMPTFWKNGNLIHFAASKNHLGIYPGDMTGSPFAKRLEGYQTSKGTIRFPYDKIDYKLIADITKWTAEGRPVIDG